MVGEVRQQPVVEQGAAGGVESEIGLVEAGSGGRETPARPMMPSAERIPRDSLRTRRLAAARSKSVTSAWAKSSSQPGCSSRADAGDPVDGEVGVGLRLLDEAGAPQHVLVLEWFGPEEHPGLLTTGRSSPVTRRISVVLPAPLRPEEAMDAIGLE